MLFLWHQLPFTSLYTGALWRYPAIVEQLWHGYHRGVYLSNGMCAPRPRGYRLETVISQMEAHINYATTRYCHHRSRTDRPHRSL